MCRKICTYNWHRQMQLRARIGLHVWGFTMLKRVASLGRKLFTEEAKAQTYLRPRDLEGCCYGTSEASAAEVGARMRASFIHMGNFGVVLWLAAVKKT